MKLSSAKRIRNRRENIVLYELLQKGYEVFHKGYPDFLVYDEANNELSFIEVKRKQRRKTKKMGLSKHQQRVIEILKKFHKVEIRYIS